MTSFVLGGILSSLAWGLAVVAWRRPQDALPVVADRLAASTTEALRPLVRRGWWTIANATLGRYGDIDHLAIGPAGIVLIESTTARDMSGSADVDAAVRQVQHNVREVASVLRASIHGAPIQPVVAVWGASVALEPTTRDDGILVIAGQHLDAWIETLTGDALTDDEVEHVHALLLALVTQRDDDVRRLAADVPSGPVRHLSTRAA
jgi:hypothetical protein